VDLRAIIAAHARAAGIEQISTSARCTKCDNDVFYSHRAGDTERQIAVLAAVLDCA
jgi:copper oxidase (laccase) domain-containing protein